MFEVLYSLLSLNINKESRTSHSDLLDVLRDRGYRVTASRRAIAEHLEQKREGFAIEEVSEELPSVARATLFRTIKLFLEAGVICRLILMDGTLKYSLAHIDQHHHHSVCVECGSVDEFRAAAVERLLSEIRIEACCEVVDHHLELYVSCGHCPDDEGN